MAIRDFYSDVDLKANQLFNSRLHNITTAARIILGGTLSTSDKGYMVYDTDLSSPYFWDGTQWLAAGGGGGAVWGSITGTLTAQTDLTAYLTANYYPFSSNPAGYLTSETDPVFSAWLATPPNISIFNNDSGYLNSIPTLQQVLTAGNSATTSIDILNTNIAAYNTGVTNLAALSGGSGSITLKTGGTNAFIYASNLSTTDKNIELPDSTGTLAMSVNGVFAGIDGAITIPVGTGTVTGTGTINVLPKWSTTGSTLHDSIVQQVSTNNIQIGSSSIAGTRLDLFSSDRADFRMYPGNTTTEYFQIYSYGTAGYGTSYTQIGLNDGITSNQQGGALYLDTRGSLPPLSLMVKDNTTNVMTYALSVATSGNVGIGTTTPAYKLDVDGTVRIKASTTGNVFRITNSTNNDLVTVDADGSTVIGQNSITTIPLTIVGNSGVQAIIGNSTFASPQSIFRYGGGKLDFYGSNNDGIGFDYKFNNSQQSTSVTSAMINLGGIYNNQQSFQFANLLISPTYDFAANTNTNAIARGILYNPTITNLRTATHIAFQNVSGDIIHGNLATGGAAQMVTADSTGKLGIQTIPSGGGGTVTSVDLSMPSAFTVTGNPVTTSGTLAVTGAGTVSQYVRGDGTLANFPNSTGGGSSINYYLNGSVSQGTFGGDTYYQMSKTPILGAGTNFTRTNGAGNGYIASFITDAGDPSQLNIPGGNWNLEFYFQSSASGGSPQFYGEIYKVSATNVFTLIASGSANPEGITNGTTVDQYFTSISVPATTLLITDRLAVRIYVITGGRTLTLHTENGNLCEVLTTFTTGLTALNGLTEQVQNFATGTSGTDFGISSASATHTFNLPTASATNRGALSTSDWSTFNGKQNSRSVNVVSIDTTAGNTANTDYVYLVSGTTTITLPTAVGNTNQYTIKRVNTGVVSIATTSSQTIDGSALPITINVQNVSLTLVSNGTNWNII